MSETFADRVTSICQAATSHNYGDTVLAVDQSFLSDDVVVQMSSWPRAEEARRELTRRGIDAQHEGDCLLRVRRSS